MNTIDDRPVLESRGALWTGRLLTALCALFLLFDALSQIAKPAPVANAFNRLGMPIALSGPIGILELVCIAVYIVPLTTVFGPVLLTGYLGGAIATNLRAGSPLFAETLFPVYFGIALWAGVVLRDRDVLVFIPIRRRSGANR